VVSRSFCLSRLYKEDAFGKKGEILQRKALKKSKKRGRREQKKPTTHTYTHTKSGVSCARAFIPRERTHGRRERNKKKSERRAPTFIFAFVARALAMDVRPVRPSVVGRRPVNFSFFSLSRFTKNTTPFSKKRGLKFWKRCRALRAIYDAHRFVDAEKNETNETSARRAFVWDCFYLPKSTRTSRTHEKRPVFCVFFFASEAQISSSDFFEVASTLLSREGNFLLLTSRKKSAVEFSLH